MKRVGKKPDSALILSTLKDFQRKTVEHVFRRLYTDNDCTRRFLIADEVGLGKTLVAKGVVAKAIDHLWESVPRIDIVYICSNADIARQNIARLNVMPDEAFTMPDRITLLPKSVHGLEKNRLNFVAFTPGTSFHLKSSSGRVEERAMLFRLLKDHWGLFGKAPRYVMQAGASLKTFDYWCKWYFSDSVDIEEKLHVAFVKELDAVVAEARRDGQADIKSRFDHLCSVFSRADAKVGVEDWRERTNLIGELRELLAAVCLEALRPDLIILDEFQRFKHLLKDDSPAGKLAQNLFRFTDETEGSEARVILLSATPYKMYSMNHEVEEDNHYEDFHATLKFLQEDNRQETKIESLLGAYSAEFFQPSGVNIDRLVSIKSELELHLRKVMVRTEKLTMTKDRDGMLLSVPCGKKLLQPQDLHAFVRTQRLAEYLDQGSVVEYWRSAPYLLNFMDNYEFKHRFRRELARRQNSEWSGLFRDRKHWLLRWSDISGYREVDPANAKLRSLLADTVGRGAWRLLWIPPSLPYYLLAEPFSQFAASGITKRLVFSCWKMVPKVIAALTSYEAERQAMRSFDSKVINSQNVRNARSRRLTFDVVDNRTTGMPVLGIIYPAVRLSELCDPLALRRECFKDQAPSIEHIVKMAEARVAEALSAIPSGRTERGPADERWYWAAGAILDTMANAEKAMGWFNQESLPAQWRAYSMRSDKTDESWESHIHEMIKINLESRLGAFVLGRQPDDLVTVLAQIGLGGPACCALRALTRHEGSTANKWDLTIRNLAGAVGHASLSLFNTPEATAIIRGENQQEPYWLRVVEYCGAGCLQSVMDEYVHVMRESLGLHQKSVIEAAPDLANAIADALSIRTGQAGLDDIRISTSSKSGVVSNPKYLRVRFGMRFGSDASDEGGEITREDQVRASFNSPFWPFVLATTSIGQEGLDFHQYCHAVVHWNLPSNPVDLEQREGRVHRYKGHAVRRNLATDFSDIAWASDRSDPWQAMFNAALDARPAGSSDIHPFWVLPSENGCHIERHVLNLPLSRDEERLIELRRTLAAYRMVFGQPRQEDMLQYLMRRFPEGNLAEIAELLRINLEPPMESLLDEYSTEIVTCAEPTTGCPE